MSRKISDFFTKKSIKIESKCSNLNESSAENSQNLTSNNNSEQENQTRINENVKNESEKQLLAILPQQKIDKFRVPVKIENNEPKNEMNKCKICYKNYSTKYTLLRHVKNVHENLGSYKCAVCKVQFNAKSYLNAHQRVHMENRPKPFKCHKCDFATYTKSNIKKHIKTHDRIIERCDKCNTILYKNRTHDCSLDCQYCGKKFSLNMTVINHIKKHHPQEIKRSLYECDICGLKCYQKKYLNIHMVKKHADGKNQIFTCDLDGKTFNLKSKLVLHMNSHLSSVKCDFCHIKVNINYLKYHIINFHTGFKPPKRQPIKKFIPKTKTFQCKICSKILSTKSILKRHISEHNKTIKCKFCDKMFGNQSRLKDHIKDIHENPDGIRCEICNKHLTHALHLRIHLKTHDPNRRREFKCLQCDFATDNKSHFKNHLDFHKRKNAKIAAIKNPLKCPQCPAIFRNQNNLSGHISSVHPKDLLECDICGRMFKTKGALLTHFRGPHKIGS